MEPFLHRSVMVAYRDTVALGGDTEEAFEAAVDVINDALPDLDDDEARALAARLIATEPPHLIGDAMPLCGTRPRRAVF